VNTEDGASGSVVGIMLQAGRPAGSIPNEVIVFFNLHNPSSRNMAPGSTQPITEISTKNLSGGNGRPVHKAENLTAVCEQII
jgi:hypothetical protein